MLDKEFQILLQQPESTILDFKKRQYDFSNDGDSKKVADFVKDVLSFCNTIRSETAYIIMGIEIGVDGKKNLIGIDDHIDDSIFQEKIKNKVYPIPKFSFFNIEYDNKVFGVVEIPVIKYETPLSPTIKLRGLEPGKFYFRRGSSNSEANGHECISIAKWLEGLPDNYGRKSLSSVAADLIGMVIQMNLPLSTCISEVLVVANSYRQSDLILFCSRELSGFKGAISNEEIHKTYSYRTNEILFSPSKFEFRSYSSWDARRVLRELRNTEGVYRCQMFFSQSIIEIEEISRRLSQSNSSLCTHEMSADKIIENDLFKDVNVTIFTGHDNYDNLIRNIRQKLIDMLLCVQ